MSRRLAREGIYKGRAIGWAVRKLPTGSIAIRVEFEVHQRMEPDGSWKPGPAASVAGDFFVIKQTGQPNETVASMLCETIGWGGTFAETTETLPLDAVVQIEVEGRDWKGKTYFDAKWIRQENDAGKKRSAGNEDLDAVAVVNLDKKHAADLRAIAAKAKKPAATNPDDGIPF